ncbi:MAG TPA: flagellar filament capping protein FliD [Polyangiales bacterium]
MASPITFSGLASGIDSASLIDALVKSAQDPNTNLQSDKSANSSQSQKITDIKTKLTALQTAAQALDTKREALGNKSTTSDDKVLTVTSTGGASMGNYKVNVTSLAQAQRTYGNKFAASDQTGLVGTGKLTLKVGTADAIEIDVDSEDTLASVAKKINASGAQVSAGVLNDGNGGFRLQVSGTQPGAKNAITFTEESGLSLGLATPYKEVPASDAVLTVDGVEVTSTSNTITGAVPGVTLNLTDLGSSVVKVDRDGDGLKTKLNAFVKSYNDVMNSLNAAFTYNGTTKGADTLAGDTTMKQLQMSLRSLVGKNIANGDSSMTMLSSVGISAQRDGTLSLDDTKFSAAVNKDYEGVASLLAGRTDGTGLMKQISDGLAGYTKTGGTLSTKIDNLSKRNKQIDTQITAMQSRIDKYRSNLEKQYSALETTVAGLNSQGNSLASILSSR